MSYIKPETSLESDWANRSKREDAAYTNYRKLLNKFAANPGSLTPEEQETIFENLEDIGNLTTPTFDYQMELGE